MMNSLTLELLWKDVHCKELQCSVQVDGWSGTASAYVSEVDLQEFAAQLQEFAISKKYEVILQLGDTSGYGGISLRFYEWNRSGSVAFHVHLVASEAIVGAHSADSWELAVDVKTERGLIDSFLVQFDNLRNGKVTSCSLECL
jgi:hypothetical protein